MQHGARDRRCDDDADCDPDIRGDPDADPDPNADSGPDVMKALALIALYIGLGLGAWAAAIVLLSQGVVPPLVPVHRVHLIHVEAVEP